jgi:3-methyladenine DNA glycosylase AlkD
MNKDKAILYKLSKSNSLWERRVSMISTYYFIKNNHFQDTFNIADNLINDKHDLIHKAVGWMLREVGKRDLEQEKEFLMKHYKTMPRTALRYAIEKMSLKDRTFFLDKK